MCDYKVCLEIIKRTNLRRAHEEICALLRFRGCRYDYD